MPKLEEQLRGLRLRALTERDKAKVWQNVIQTRTSQLTYQWSMKRILASALAVTFIFGSVGAVSASNAAGPGDLLFPLDLALEKAQLTLAGDDKSQDLTLAFAEERVDEIRSLVSDLSQATVTSVEVDVFTNETVVDIEANDKHFIYTTALTAQSDIVAEIAAKYSIPTTTISSVLDFQIEDRASQPEDKIIRSNSAPSSDTAATTGTTTTTTQVNKNVTKGFTQLEMLLAGLRDQDRAQEVRQSLVDVMLLLGDGAKVELRSDAGRIKLENKDGEVRVQIDDRSNDDSDDDNDNATPSTTTDIRENDNEVFCRGEWRDPQDCDNGSDEDESDDDNHATSGRNDDHGGSNSGSGSGDNDDDDSDDDNDNATPSTTTDVREDDDEVFCRGEWRDAEDCDEDSLDDEDEDEDEDKDDDDKDDDDNNSGSGSSGSSNSGSGSSGSSGSSSSGGLTKYTTAQVSTHTSASDCWAIVNGGVYNLTSWISSHPGGESAILGLCGTDGSSTFNAIHGGSSQANAALASFKIGTL